jgi:hypothetical protein
VPEPSAFWALALLRKQQAKPEPCCFMGYWHLGDSTPRSGVANATGEARSLGYAQCLRPVAYATLLWRSHAWAMPRLRTASLAKPEGRANAQKALLLRFSGFARGGEASLLQNIRLMTSTGCCLPT